MYCTWLGLGLRPRYSDLGIYYISNWEQTCIGIGRLVIQKLNNYPNQMETKCCWKEFLKQPKLTVMELRYWIAPLSFMKHGWLNDWPNPPNIGHQCDLVRCSLSIMLKTYIIDLLSERVCPTAPGNFQVGESMLDTPWVYYQLYIFVSAGYIPTSASSLTEMARGETSTSSTIYILLNPHVFDSPWNIWKSF